MNKSVLVFGSLVLVAIAVVAWHADALGRGYAFQPNMAIASASTITALLAVTLFVERGMAAVNAIVFGDAQRVAERQLIEGGSGALTSLSIVLGIKERVRLFGSFLAGLFVSAARVRTIEGLVQTGTGPLPTSALLIPVDIVLTAALIAGGSNGLAFLLQLAKDMLTEAAPPGGATPVPRVLPKVAPEGTGDRGESAIAQARDIRRIRARLTSMG